MLGRILYYDTRDREVILNTGYIDNHLNDEVIEQYYLQLEKQFGNRDYIAHKLLNHLEFEEEFRKFSHVRVTLDDEVFFSNKETKYRLGLKYTMTDRWFPLFEIESKIYDPVNNQIDFDLLQYFYQDFLRFNLKNVCKHKDIDCYWLSPNQFRRMNNSNEKAIVRWDEDIFPSQFEFAKELLQNGFIFPMQTKLRDGQHYILDGSHRMVATQTLERNDQWNGNKMLTLQFNTSNVNFIENPQINYVMSEPVTMHIPKALFNKYSFIQYSNLREYDENIYEFELTRYLDMVIMFRMYVTELTRPIKKYCDLSGLYFPTFELLNNQEVFEKWLLEE